MRSLCHILVCLLAWAVVAAGNSDARAATRHPHHAKHHQAEKVEHQKHRSVAAAKHSAPAAVLLPVDRPALANLPPDLASAKQALELASRDKVVEATALENSTANPVVRKLIEWALLRRGDGIEFRRYKAFIAENPDWPGIPLLRKRAEVALWREHADPATARSFLDGKPVGPAGRLVLARVLMSDGDQAGAAQEIRAVWRSAPLSAELETALLKEFPDVITRDDQLARMDERIGAKDFGAAMRAAKKVGEDQAAIVKACIAAEAKSANGGKLLDAVPVQTRDDLGYALCRIHWLLRNDSPGSNIHGRIVTPREDVALAVKLTLGASQAGLQQQDTDEWWRERRALARKLLDLGEAATAYKVVATSAPPANPYYRTEFHFMAGWIALRFLHDPTTASKDFALVGHDQTDPRILARGAYWRARAAEAAGDITQMRTQYEAASHYPTAYYGQLARIKLGLPRLPLPPSPQAADPAGSDVLQAAGMLYAIDERDLALTFASEVAEKCNRTDVIAGLAKLAAQNHDAQATLLIGEKALERGMAFERYAFPNFGLPSYGAIGPALDPSVVYAVARTESGFNPRDRSSADAVGLMQVTPDAGRDTAKRFGVSYDWHRIVADPSYNTAMGAAELAALMNEYGSSHILTFAAYNAGRGRVQQWLTLHGDPRDAKSDPVDWVERIPFAETRNYVERVMENLYVYRTRFNSAVATDGREQHPAYKTSAEPDLVETVRH
jgi:peptidoglycan lytic transglycosylase